MFQSQQQRPSFYIQLPGYLFSNGHTESKVAKGMKPVRDQDAHQQPSECSPLLGAPRTSYNLPASASSDRLCSRSLSTSTVARPNITRAFTTVASTHTDISATPSSSRPILNRGLTSTAALIGRPEYYPEATLKAAMERPPLLSRAARAITRQLELADGTSYAHRNAPPAPSFWNENTHHCYLVRLWDAVNDQAANSKYTVSTTARVVSTEKSMIHAFPELAKGDKILSRDWVEYVLGVALRHPFCTTEKMGRWEVLASSSGARGTWGPW